MFLIAITALLVWAPSAGAADAPPQELPGPVNSPGRVEPTEKVNLDKLLKLPSSYRFDDSRRSGATRSEWRARFEEARSSLEEVQQELERVRAELKNLVGGAAQYQMMPPGMETQSAENPVSYRLTQELRRGREEVERAEHVLTELDVEANLAGVPEDWRY